MRVWDTRHSLGKESQMRSNLQLMQIIDIALRRAVVTFGELLIELLLLGIYFGILVVPGNTAAIVVAVLPVFAVLLSAGYYFMRPLLGLCWGSKAPLLYGIFSGLLFVIHTFVVYSANRSSLSSRAHDIAAPFLIGGWTISAMTAVLGRYCLKRWSSHIELSRSSRNSAK